VTVTPNTIIFLKNYEKVTTELVNDIVKVLSKEREKMAYHIQKQMLVTYWNIR
jgi:hypothetical protein